MTITSAIWVSSIFLIALYGLYEAWTSYGEEKWGGIVIAIGFSSMGIFLLWLFYQTFGWSLK